nr:DUF4173 domain-containing protein [Ignavibacteria bacterium]
MIKPRILMTIILLVVFNFLFWGEKLGVNLFIFFFLGIISMIMLNEDNIKNKNVITSLFALLFSLGMVIVNNSFYSKFSSVICFMMFTGFIHQPALKTTYSAVFTAVADFVIFPYNVYSELKYSATKFKPVRVFLKFSRLALIPVIFFVIFYAIYAYSNPVFNSYSVSFWDTIGKYLYDIFINYPLLRFFYLLFGLMVIMAFIYNRSIRIFSEVDNAYHDTLQRSKVFKVHSRTKPVVKSHLMYTLFSYRFKFNSLKLETKMGIVLLGMTNALLLMLNVIDIQVTWLGFNAGEIENLAYYVHEGTYYLIFSILLSMAILLVIFRGSQNYLAKNRILKFLAYAWLAQNAFMAISVALRNIYYIEFYYALSYKRIGVMIFLLLTLFGLGTMFVKIYARKTTSFLFKINSTAVVAVLLLMSSFSWDKTIAEFNLSNPDRSKIDIDYLLKLSDDALPVLDAHKELLDKEYLQYSFIFSDYTNGLDEYKRRVHRFIAEQKRYSWLSWNLSDRNTLDFYAANEFEKKYPENRRERFNNNLRIEPKTGNEEPVLDQRKNDLKRDDNVPQEE